MEVAEHEDTIQQETIQPQNGTFVIDVSLNNTSVTVDEIGALDGSIVTFGPTDVAGQSTPYKDNLKDLNQCETCGTVYKSRSGLQSHKAMKHAQPKYECKICTKKFQSKTLYKAHIMLHVEEKQYKCDVCSKEYVHKKDLSAHIKAKHGNHDGFKCKECGNIYQYEQGLQKHVNAMHKGISFACAICNSRFVYRANLRRHMKNKH